MYDHRALLALVLATLNFVSLKKNDKQINYLRYDLSSLFFGSTGSSLCFPGIEDALSKNLGS